MARRFDVLAFSNNPADYIGAHKLLIDSIDSNAFLTDSKKQTISVNVQKEDNYFEKITENIDYIELLPSACERTLYFRIQATGEYVFGKAKEQKVDSPVDAYYLPWNEGVAYAVRLGNKHDYFATPKVNGCCVFISGTRANPLVIHANYNSDRLEPPNMTREELMAAYGKHQFKQYTRFYGNFASKLIDDKIIGEKDPVSVYDPEFYLSRGNLATMYGVRKDCGWKFYYNLGTGTSNVTAELWPAIVNTIPVPEPKRRTCGLQ